MKVVFVLRLVIKIRMKMIYMLCKNLYYVVRVKNINWVIKINDKIYICLIVNILIRFGFRDVIIVRYDLVMNLLFKNIKI